MRLLKPFSLGVGAILSASVFAFLLSSATQAKDIKQPYAIPEFTQTSAQEWLNSKPLSKKDLLGKITLVDFWSYGCWNCYRSFPWLHGVEAQYKPQGFQVIGVHAPEFEHEKKHENVKAAIKKFKITNPVMVDNDMAFWGRMNNRYWPSYYIVDKKGRVRANFIGETHKGDDQAQRIEATIRKLLAE